jgi:hypothetical protein
MTTIEDFEVATQEETIVLIDMFQSPPEEDDLNEVLQAMFLT